MGHSKNLAAIWDSAMSLDRHVNNVCRKARIHLYSMCRVRTYMEENAAKSLLLSL